MIHTTVPRRPCHRGRLDGGFTLIELLVVVVILGILSAVVVFAVRGVSDKGGSAAVATDARTIRTAEEAFCAKFGKYAEMGTAAREPGTLVGERFLSDPSTLNKPELTPDGPCKGGYKVTPIPTGVSATTTTTIPSNPPSWTRLGLPPTTGVSFTDANHGVLDLGNAVDVTTDGGKTWTKHLFPSSFCGSCDSTSYQRIKMVDNNTILALKRQWADTRFPELIRSTDGGKTWAPVVGVVSFAHALDCFGQTCWVGGDVKSPLPFGSTDTVYLARSTDGGATWTELASAEAALTSKNTRCELAGNCYFAGIHAASSELVFATTSDHLIRSEDRGDSWTVLDSWVPCSGCPSDISSRQFNLHDDGISFVPSTCARSPAADGSISGCTGFLVMSSALSGTTDEVVYKTTDGGNSWTAAVMPRTAPQNGSKDLWVVSAADVEHVFAAGTTLWDTATGGGSTSDWTKRDVAPGGESFGQFIDPTHGWAIISGTVWYYGS